MVLILHIVEVSVWARAQAAGRYEAASLASQGFIHCSLPNQAVRVANALFRGRQDLVLLVIDPERLRAEVRYENLEGGNRLFPHVYGSVSLDAIVDVLPFPAGPDGAFDLPGVLLAD